MIEGIFDPITQKELCDLRSYQKENHIKDLYVRVSKEKAILPYEMRVACLKKALAPYRHMHVSTDYSLPAIQWEADETETMVHHGAFRLCAKGIGKYLFENNAYLDEIVQALCKPRRAVHSKGVAETAAHLAEVHHKDANLAYRAGMLHDITKKLTNEENQKILSVWYPEVLDKDPAIWHSYSAVFYLKHEMGIYDSAICNAIWHHTIGDGHSALARMIYIADKIEPNRGYDSSYEMKLADENLQTGADYVLEQSRKYILEKEGKNV